MRILIVEDNSETALILRRTLEKVGHTVTIAADGAEAWDLLKQETFPLVISDWMMPILDGPSLCRRIRAREGVPYTYIILMTSRSEHEERLEGLSSGADDFLAKNLGHGDLFARLEIARRILTMQEEMQTLNARLDSQNQELAERVSLLAAANLRLEELATSDGLTGLKNHRFLQDSLLSNFSFSRRQLLPLSMIMLDVDHFKAHNDAFGHPAGDGVLRQIALLLQESVREHDVVARYGGEEFSVLLPATTKRDALIVARRLREAVEAFAWRERPVQISVGVSTYDPAISRPLATPGELLDQADAALYWSKQQGRNQVNHSCEMPKAVRRLAKAA